LNKKAGEPMEDEEEQVEKKVYRKCICCGAPVYAKFEVFCKKGSCRKKGNKDSKYMKTFSIGRV